MSILFNVGYLHALVVQKTDGSVLYSAGSIGKDPALIAGYVSAFTSMDQEFVIAGDISNKGYRSRFYHLGNVLLLIGGDESLIVYTVFAEVEPDLIDELQDILKEIFELFVKVALEGLSEEELDLGIVPEDRIEKFEEELFKFFLSKKFIKYARLSDLFIGSETGPRVVKFFLKNLYNKIKVALGKHTFWVVIETATKISSSDVRFHDVIKIIDEEKINLIIPKNIPSDIYYIQLCRMLYNARILVQGAIGKKVLEEGILFEGAGRFVGFNTIKH